MINLCVSISKDIRDPTDFRTPYRVRLAGRGWVLPESVLRWFVQRRHPDAELWRDVSRLELRESRVNLMAHVQEDLGMAVVRRLLEQQDPQPGDAQYPIEATPESSLWEYMTYLVDRWGHEACAVTLDAAVEGRRI